MQGWVSIHRQLLSWEWYDDHNTCRLFIHLLLIANHKDKSYKGVTIERGQIMTGQELLAKQTKLTRQQIRTCINRLKSTNEITIKTSSQGTIIQIVNYDKFQQATNNTTNDQPTINQRSTTNNNDKNDNNVVVGTENLHQHQNISSLKTDSLKNKEWVAGACTSLSLKNETELSKALDKFNEHLSTQKGEQVKLKKDYISHFMSWYRIAHPVNAGVQGITREQLEGQDKRNEEFESK